MTRAGECETCGGSGWNVYPSIETQGLVKVPCSDCDGHQDLRALVSTPGAFVTMTFSKAMAPTMARALMLAADSGKFAPVDIQWLEDWARDIA